MSLELKDKLEGLLKLYERQMSHFEHTQQIEWKANFGIWTLLAAAIYAVIKEGVHVCKGWQIATALTLLVGIHGVWLFLVQSSERIDRNHWWQFRAEALMVIRGEPNPANQTTLLDQEKTRKDGLLLKIFRGSGWLFIAVMITTLLCLVLYSSLPEKCPPLGNSHQDQTMPSVRSRD